MRHVWLIACVFVGVGCAGSPSDPGAPDAGGGSGSGGGSQQAVCPLPASTADTGALSASKAELCNVPGSMGKSHWYRVAATLPGSSVNYVEVDLYDGTGAFAGGTVKTGTFPVDTSFASCGVCVRGLGDKAGTDQKEYFATA